jgi:tetratricopeptide (TPR) repeat protein
MSIARFRTLNVVGVLCLMLSFSALALDSSGTNEMAAPGAGTNDASQAVSPTASDEALRAYLQLQEQIHEAQLAIERNRQESEDAAAKSAKALADRLGAIEDSLAAQRASEVEAVQRANEAAQRANHSMLIVVSAFAALGCLAILLTAYLQWRAVNRFTALSAAFPAGNALNSWSALAALEGGDKSLAIVGPPEPVNARLLAAIERLEKRIQDLERTSRSPLADASAVSNILDLQASEETRAPGPVENGSGEKGSESTTILGKGQSLLNLGKLEEAVGCFDEVLSREPDNTEALVKKGTALERLRRPQEALACYDHAIAADSSMTIAYLYKGGLYNRMERFSEALECYERALHTQEKRRVS